MTNKNSVKNAPISATIAIYWFCVKVAFGYSFCLTLQLSIWATRLFRTSSCFLAWASWALCMLSIATRICYPSMEEVCGA